MMQDIMKMAAGLIIAIPFIYMAMDVAVDIIKRGISFYRRFAW